ncbi:MAG: polyphosphate polymerase domain-containing protein [Candidatus Fermentibacteraceae bacterium]|nr:polyphosphate polymerase domain-containing protein [Candidatus Fermentibacteraceae bacterium]MBN2609320.1 polyphosphate polymerase domain-containing protein [Candidatus Fermentibacteraceae bacterium]
MTSADAPRLHFHRYEFKYILRTDELPGIVREMDLRLEKDIHSGSDGGYFVRSHYFDTDGFDLYYEKLAGLRKRYKFRLRSYSSATLYSRPLFLELKGRNNTLVYKHRMLLDPSMAEESLGRGTMDLATTLMEGGGLCKTGERFVFDAFRKRISPSVVVDYHRTAWENRANPDFRVTLDTGILAYRAGGSGHPTGEGRMISDGLHVLEIKFRYRMPAWFLRLIQEFQLGLVSFSKFAYATGAVYMDSMPGRLDRIFERRPACLS